MFLGHSTTPQEPDHHSISCADCRVKKTLTVNPYKPDTYVNSADPDHAPLNAVSDEGLHCLLT